MSLQLDQNMIHGQRMLGLLLSAALQFIAMHSAYSQPRLLDSLESSSGWSVITSDGVRANLTSAPGNHGNALVLDFEFYAGSGYAIAQKRFPLELPENYKFTFYLRGETPVNNFEFKLLDSLDNVYWIKQLNVDYPAEWTKKTIRKRHRRRRNQEGRSH